MSSSSLAFFNSFTLEEKQNRRPGDNYIAKLGPNPGQDIATPSKVKKRKGRKKEKDKDHLRIEGKRNSCSTGGGNSRKRKTWPFLKPDSTVMCSEREAKPKPTALNQV